MRHRLALVFLLWGAAEAHAFDGQASAPESASPSAPATGARLLKASFTKTGLQQVLDTLGNMAGVTMRFDGAFRDRLVSCAVADQAFEQAMAQLGATHGFFVKMLDPAIALVAPDTPESRAYWNTWTEVGLPPLPGDPLVTRSFQDESLQQILEALAGLGGSKALFDRDYRDLRVNYQFTGVPLQAALRRTVLLQRLFLKPLDSRTFMVVPDTPAKRRSYDAWTPSQPLAAVRNREPITAVFTAASLRHVFDTLGRDAGVTFVYDRSFRDRPVTIRFEGETFEAALDQLTITQGLFYQPVEGGALAVAPDWKRHKTP